MKLDRNKKIGDYIYTDHFNKIRQYVSDKDLGDDFAIKMFKFLQLVECMYDNDIDKNAKNKLAEISGKKIQKHLGVMKYKKYIEALERCDIIYVYPHFIIGVRCYGYFLLETTGSEVISLQKIIADTYDTVIEYKYNVTMDVARQKKYLDNKYRRADIEGKLYRKYKQLFPITKQEHKILLQLSTDPIEKREVDKLYNGFLYFNRNETNYRISTNLTNIKKHLRKSFLAMRGLYEADISASQPYILGFLLQGIYHPLLEQLDTTTAPQVDANELSSFIDTTTSGQLYKYWVKKYYDLTGIELDDEEAKKKILTVLYSPNSTWKYDSKMWCDNFKSVFPTIYNYIQWLKSDKTFYQTTFDVDIMNSNNKKNNKRGAHSFFAILMQRVESNDIIDTICSNLLNNNVSELITIHDAIVVSSDDISLAMETMINAYPKTYQPNIKTKQLCIEDIEGNKYTTGEEVINTTVKKKKKS